MIDDDDMAPEQIGTQFGGNKTNYSWWRDVLIARNREKGLSHRALKKAHPRNTKQNLYSIFRKTLKLVVLQEILIKPSRAYQ